MKLYISPSSQEHNVGANGYNEETEMNLIADILIPELLRHDIEVMRNNRKNDFNAHIKESNLYKPNYHIAMHSNATGGVNTSVRGCIVFCYDADDKTRKGTVLASNLYKYLSPLTPVNDRGIATGRGTLSEIAYTKAPAAFVEVDFHDNANGAAWITAHKPEIAQAYLMGILDTCGIKYIPKVTTIYRVQVGAFGVYANAEKQLEKLVTAGFNGYIVKGEK